MSHEGVFVAPQPRIHSSLKRSACDRCRNQKLRCPRHGSNTDPCTRCIRAGIECTTGSAKPLRRRNAVSSTLIRGDSRYIIDDLAMRSAEHVQVEDALLQLGGESINTSSWLASEDSTIFDFLGDDAGLGSGRTVFAGSPSTDSPPDSSCISLPGLSFSPITTPSVETLSFDGEEAPTSPSIGSGTVNRVWTHFTENCDIGSRFASLNLTLSRQLSLARSGPCGIRQMGFTSPDIARQMREQHQGQTETEQLGQILDNTSEFLSIIQSCDREESEPPNGKDLGRRHSSLPSNSLPEQRRHLSSPLRSSESFKPACTCSFSLPSSSTIPSEPAGLRTTTILTLFSCYLHIIAIYDTIFGQIYAVLATMPASLVSKWQAVPGLHLGGFSVQHGGLQMKILIQVIQHQFEMIEVALGLPVEYRVSDGRHDVPHGLLVGTEVVGLWQVFMGAADGLATGSGTRTVESLRGNIKKVQRLL